MSDPVIETAQQQATELAGAAGATGTGLMLLVIGAITKLWRVIFGTPKDRAEAHATEAAAHVRVAEVATEALEAQREDTKSMRAERDLAYDERDDCKDALRKMDARLTASEQRERACVERAQAQENQNAWMERALNAVVAGEPVPPRPEPHPDSTPRRNPHPNEVRAAVELARKEN